MRPKKNPSKDPTDSEAEKQFREERIAQELFHRSEPNCLSQQGKLWTLMMKMLHYQA